jgi:hypothetical protein
VLATVVPFVDHAVPLVDGPVMVSPVAAAAANPYLTYSVTSYGAIGNGISDDTAGIQAAINAAAAGKATIVWFPAGVYRITAPLVLPLKVSLLGAGSGTDAGASIIRAAVSMTSMLVLNDAANSSIEGLAFDGGADRGVAIPLALDLADFLGSRMAEVAIRNVSGDGFYSRWVDSAAGYSWANYFTNLDIAVAGYAFRMGSSDSHITGVRVTGGLGGSEEQSSGNLYRDCVFENCVNGMSFRNTSGASARTSFADCTFRNNGRYGLACEFPTASFQSAVAVDGCVFEGNGRADLGLGNCSLIAVHGSEFRTAAPAAGASIEFSGTLDSVAVTECRFATAGVMLPGTKSVAASNVFSSRSWAVTGAGPRDPSLLLPSAGSLRDVKSYGAKGNAAADDTAAVQAALDAAQPGDTVFFPAGGYKIMQPLQLRKSGITLLGEGWGNYGGSKILAGTSLASLMTTPVAVTGVRMAKIVFGHLGTTPVIRTLDFSRMSDSRLETVKLNASQGIGIVMGADSARNVLVNCHIQKPEGVGIILGGREHVVAGTYVSCEGEVGIRLEGDGGHRIVTTHVDLETVAGILVTTPATGVASSQIRNCYFDMGSATGWDTATPPANTAIAVEFAAPTAARLSITACLFRVNNIDVGVTNASDVTMVGCTSTPRVPAQGGTVELVTTGVVDGLRVVGNVQANARYVPGPASVVFGNATAQTISVALSEPDLSAAAVSSVRITFAAAVTGFDLGDLVLTRDGLGVPLAGATLTTTDNRVFVLGGLGGKTAVDGVYRLDVNGTGAGVKTTGNVTVVQRVTADWTLAAVVTVPTGQTWTDALPRANAARLVKRGGGVLVAPLDATFTGGTTVEEGSLVVRSQGALGLGALTIRDGAQVMLDVADARPTISSLALAAYGRIDVGRGGLVVSEGYGDPLAVVAALRAGREDGQWSGTSGIITSATTAGGLMGVGYVVNSGTVTIAFAIAGDTNLDGLVDITDVANVMSNGAFNSGEPLGWADGDFNYDGIFDILDIADFWSAEQYDAGPY